jgi:hypothetical protein
LAIVGTLVESAPDKALEALNAALESAGGDTALAQVRRIVEAEARDRQLRNAALLPIVPMCVGAGRDPDRLVFPALVLPRLWRALKVRASEAVAAAESAVYEYRPDAVVTERFDRLVAAAVKGLRAGEAPEFEAVAKLCDEAKPGGAELLAACLDLAPLVRRVAPKVADYTSQLSEDGLYALRAAYNDAAAVSRDAGIRFFRMLAAQLPFDWMILRIACAVMGDPSERRLAESDFKIFGDLVLTHIASALRGIADIDLDGGLPAAAAVARLVLKITTEASEMETTVPLARDHGWGQTLLKHRKTLAEVVEGRLRDCDKYFNQALPCGRPGWKSIRRGQPRLGVAPDETAIRRCETLLAFVRDVRHSANYGGFASARTRLLETLAEQLDIYVEELLELVRSGEAENPEFARAFLGAAARFSRLIEDDKAASLIRRRTAAAFASAGDQPPERKLAAGG